ncbi:hypothetical protein PFLmoz3_05831 [Pseudomonas fluorescens]|uniref:Uncharacterized protein n=1 Tax=Pseudomonas fluorescens TaxID=294 RepID=A0A125QHK5_PSEFL|nr:hypothetical protein PFLmoz3_05831 [Pseudomonas fluorescens]
MYLAQLAQGATVLGALLRQQVPVGGGQIGQGHALLDNLLRQLAGIPEFVATHDQRRARTQGREALFDKTIETEGRKLQHAVFGAQSAVQRGTVTELAKGGMVDGHAFGLAGGARGVDHIGQVSRRRVIRRIGRRVAGQFVATDAEIHAGQAAGQRQVGEQAGFAEQHVQAAVGEHVGQTFRRVFRVQRYVGRPTFEHCQQTDDQLRAAPRSQAHPLAGADTQRQQAMGQAVGALVQLGVAQVGVTGLYSQGVWRRLGLGCDTLMHAFVGLGRCG